MLKAGRLSIPEPGEWAWAGDALLEQLRGADGETDSLLERVFQMYLPVFFWIKGVREAAKHRTAVVGIQCLQGGGKTTICDSLELLSQRDGLTCVVASIDDFYKTHAELATLAETHPDEPLLHGRGQPGTHDMGLMRETLAKLCALREGEEMQVPRYDKSAHSGQGDRAAPETWPTVAGPVDLLLLEGWCFGFQSTSRVPPFMKTVNDYLAEYDEIYAQLDAFVVMQALSARYVYAWREQAEQARRSNGEGAMTAEQVVSFVDRYYPSYQTYMPQLYAQTPCAEEDTLRFWIDAQRRCVPSPTLPHDILA